MTREQFLDFVRHPENVVSASADSIASLTGQFPYCQPLRFLYLKQLAGTDSVQYPQQLKITAALAPDRSRLFRLIHPEPDGPTSDDVMAGVYESAAVPVAEITEEAADERSAEPFTGLAASTFTTEYEAPKEEVKMSVEEIVNQRLKELNLWQDPEEVSTTTVHISPVEEQEEAPAIQTSETSHEVSSVLDINTADEPAEISYTETPPSPEISPEVMDTLPPPVIEPETTHLPTPSESTAVSPDPLDDIIRESLAETRLRNADYFEDLLPETTASAGEESFSTDQAADNLQLQETPEESPEKYTAHTSEIHSFTDWLKLNHAASDSMERAPESATEPSAEVTATEDLALTETPVELVADINDDPKATSSTTHPSSIAEKSPAYQTPSSDPVPASVAQVKFIFLKTGADTIAAAPITASTVPPATVYTAPAISPPPAPPVAHPVPVQPIEATSPSFIPPTVTEPTVPEPTAVIEPVPEDAIIPPKKPIPDPSLVDTDPPRPKVPAGELIDKFIREEPRITPSKSTFYSPSNMAKKSILEPDDLITETLANIYAQQGNFKKAISFYQKLSLKFPEKSRYFAALIEELKKKSNS